VNIFERAMEGIPEGMVQISSNVPARTPEDWSGSVHEYLASNSRDLQLCEHRLLTVNYGWERPEAEHHFQHRRRQPDEADSHGELIMFRQMADIMNKLQKAAGAVQVTGIREPSLTYAWL